ncbi:NACHT, LRR and PYD domains-containing protein 3 isoform X2 [Pseudorasbora parva]|uniref:NACHT, LRR and PYD domains-containing protein 3 isoform X2 n=1 Tax=Pseudorasbora parva TaxID=51549 RepID=UPI00351ED181
MQSEISYDMQQLHKEALRNSVLNSTLPNSLLGGQPVREVIQRGHYTPLSVCLCNDRRDSASRGDREVFEDVISREFSPGTVGCRVVFHGGVGMGKTTVVEKVIWDWATGTRLQHYTLLLRVPVLELAALEGKAESLQGMLGRIHTQISAESLAFALQRPQSLLLVLDGLEQLQGLLCYPSSSSSLVYDVQQEATGSVLLLSLLHGSALLPGASMLITSREPFEFASLRFFEVVGFSQAQKRMFFQGFFGDVSLSDRFFQQSKQALRVDEQCFRPAFCWTLCNVFNMQLESENAPPETLTHLLSIITRMLLQKQKMHAEETRELVVGLGKLTKPVCSYNDVTSCGLRSFLHHPVLSAFFCINGDVTSPDTTFTFLSPVMQEFLLAASFYLDHSLQILDECSDLYYTFLAGLSNSVQRKPLEDSVDRFDESRMAEFLQWLMGYASTVLSDINAKKHFRVFRILLHARNSSLVKESIRKSQWRLVGYSEMQEPDCEALSYVVSCLGELEDMNLYKGKLTDEQAQKLIPALRLSKSIWLVGCELNSADCVELAKMFSGGSRLRVLNLLWSNLADQGLIHLSSALENCRLQEINMDKCSLTAASMSALSSALENGFSELRILHLSRNSLRDDGMELISQAIQKRRLNTLKVLDCELTGSCCPSLAAALQSENCCLTELDVSMNDLGQSGAMHICQALMAPACTLEKLDLSSCEMTKENFRALGSVLTSGTSRLINLSLGWNNMSDNEAKYMWQALKHKNCKLQHLDMDNFNLTDACVEELCESVAASATLSTLILENNKLTDSAVPHLVKLMLDRPLMTKLNLKYNNFSEDVFDLMDTCPNIVY